MAILAHVALRHVRAVGPPRVDGALCARALALARAWPMALLRSSTHASTSCPPRAKHPLLACSAHADIL